MRNGNHGKFVALAVLVAILVSCAGIAAAQEEMTKAELQKMYTDYLSDEGYKPSIDSDGDVVFKKESKTYFIAIRESDLEYFTVVMPNFWEIENERERLQVLIAADASNAKSKVAKVFIVKDNTWAAIEVFINKPEDFEGIFPRSLRAIDNGVDNFIEKMREQRDDSE